MKEMIIHPFKPIYDKDSKILILGSIPSPKSREMGFYYGHPQNRFWKVLANIYNEPFPDNNQKKKEFVINHHIALWDVVKSCEIKGASDSTIAHVIPNDIKSLLNQTQIKCIITTGKKADQLYQKYCFKNTKITSICLPSTSPANCAMKEELLIKKYQIIKELTK